MPPADYVIGKSALVHPINDYDQTWKKDILCDDFLDDMEIAKELAYYYVTGELLESTELC